MSIDTVRRTARHALASRRDLAHELRRMRHEKEADRLYVRRIEAELHDARVELATERRAKTAAQETTRRFDAEAAAAKAEAQQRAEEAERLAIEVRMLREQVHGRDTSDPADQVTEPIDTRTVRDEFGDDYLDRTRRAWIGPVTRIEPLYHSPLAAVIDPGQVTDDTTVEIPVLRLPAAS